MPEHFGKFAVNRLEVGTKLIYDSSSDYRRSDIPTCPAIPATENTNNLGLEKEKLGRDNGVALFTDNLENK